jgi:anti-sigma factor RsiW
MTCDTVRPLLSPYVDRELDLLVSAEIDTHLEGCPACARERDRLLALSATLRDPGLRVPLPAELAARVQRALREEAGPRRSRPSLGWGLGAAAALVCGLVGGRVLLTSGPEPAPELVSAHIRSLLPDRLLDVPSSDRHTVKPFFRGRLDFAPPVPDLASDGFPLAGGRVDVLERRRVAALVYMRRQHVVNVFVEPKTGVPPPRGPRLVDGYAVLGFEEGDFLFWAVSDVEPRELARLPGLFEKALATPSGEGPS